MLEPSIAASYASKRPAQAQTLDTSTENIQALRDIPWLWPGYIPRGGLTVIEGESSTGKTHLALDLAARVSSGLPFPDGTPCQPGHVIVITPRSPGMVTTTLLLENAGATLSNITTLTALESDVPINDMDHSYTGHTTYFSFSDLHFNLLIRTIVHTRPALLVIDPLIALKRRNLHVTDEKLMHWLERLHHLCLDQQVACLLTVKRATRGSAFKPHALEHLHHLQDIVLSSFLATRHPDNTTTFLLANTKQACAPPAPTLSYHIVAASSEHINATHVQWDEDASPFTSSDLLNPRRASDTIYGPQCQHILQVVDQAAPTSLSQDTILDKMGFPRPPDGLNNPTYAQVYHAVNRSLSRLVQAGKVHKVSRGLFLSATTPATPVSTTSTTPTLTTPISDPVLDFFCHHYAYHLSHEAAHGLLTDNSDLFMKIAAYNPKLATLLALAASNIFVPPPIPHDPTDEPLPHLDADTLSAAYGDHIVLHSFPTNNHSITTNKGQYTLPITDNPGSNVTQPAQPSSRPNPQPAQPSSRPNLQPAQPFNIMPVLTGAATLLLGTSPQLAAPSALSTSFSQTITPADSQASLPDSDTITPAESQVSFLDKTLHSEHTIGNIRSRDKQSHENTSHHKHAKHSLIHNASAKQQKPDTSSHHKNTPDNPAHNTSAKQRKSGISSHDQHASDNPAHKDASPDSASPSTGKHQLSSPTPNRPTKPVKKSHKKRERLGKPTLVRPNTNPASP